MNNSIVITTFNRQDLLLKCINAIFNCQNSNQFNLVIVYHTEIPGNATLLNSFIGDKLHLIPVDGRNKTPIDNIVDNRIIGLNYCFNILKSDYVLGIEDDIILAYDALIFTDLMMREYGHINQFRGVNLVSVEEYKPDLLYRYGLFRFAFNGQAGAFSKKTWGEINKLKLLTKYRQYGMDGSLEAYFKTGFVVMPYLSRYKDLGWSNGTHGPQNQNAESYQRIAKSFVGEVKLSAEPYTKLMSPFSYRSDCIHFFIEDNFKFYLKFICRRILIFIKRLI